MNHADVREALEVASAEPSGIDGYLAGGSPEAEDVNRHLGTCEACRTERAELRASAAAIRQVIRDTPSPDLRARTLDLVAGEQPRVPERPTTPRRAAFTWRALIPAAALSAVAAAAISGVVVWRALDARINAADAQIATQHRELEGLSAIADWTLRLGMAPDAQLVRLAAPGSGGTATGTVLLSAARGELVMLASGLPAAPAGYEYRCWIDQGNGPERIGKLYRSGAVDYWGGAVGRIQGIEGPFTLGVSLASQAGGGGETVLQGSQ